MRVRLGSIVVLGGWLAGALGGVAGADATPKATSREYKIRLRAADFADERERAELWRIVAEGAPAAGRGRSLEEKPCRRISYLDTASRDLEKAGWLVRRREDLPGGGCRSPHAVRAETTLKKRGPEAVIEEVLEENWTARAKVEEDRLVGRGSREPSMVLSVSADAHGQTEPSKVGDVQRLFEGALPEFDAGAVLSASCRVVLERRWAFEEAGLPEGIDHVELALWYRSPADPVPWLGELSFVVVLSDAEAVKAANELEARLVRRLADRLDEPGSRTAVIYRCGR